MRHKLDDAIYIAEEKLLDSKYYNDTRDTCLEYICKISDNWINILEGTLSKITDDFKWNIIDKLITQNNTTCIVYLEKLMDSCNEEEQYRATLKGLSINDLIALKCFTNIVETHGFLPEKIADRDLNLSFDTLDALPYYMSLLKVYYLGGVKEDTFGRFGQKIRDALTMLACKNNNNYKVITSEIKTFIKNNSDLKNILLLNFDIEHIEKQYYMSNSPALTLDEVKVKLRNINF